MPFSFRPGYHVDPMEELGLSAAALPFAAADLGFERLPDGGWRKLVRGRTVVFRPLRRLAELVPIEGLQRDVLGVTERDLVAASELIVVAETGGEVIGAFLGDEAEPAGAVIGWGGFVDGRPRLVSDLLAVRVERRNLGLGAELKKLQAAQALERGFGEIVWTVDPLRAANARLNFEKLGAVANRYEENRYGADFGTGLYGGLPTDRLHLTWRLRSPRVRDRLLGTAPPTTPVDVDTLRSYDPAAPLPRALVPLPADVDALLARDPPAVLRWRRDLRATLQAAFAQDYVITGFVAVGDGTSGEAAYVIERREIVAAGEEPDDPS